MGAWPVVALETKEDALPASRFVGACSRRPRMPCSTQSLLARYLPSVRPLDGGRPPSKGAFLKDGELPHLMRVKSYEKNGKRRKEKFQRKQKAARRTCSPLPSKMLQRV